MNAEDLEEESRPRWRTAPATREHEGLKTPDSDPVPERARLGLLHTIDIATAYPPSPRRASGTTPTSWFPQEPRWHGPLHGGHQGHASSMDVMADTTYALQQVVSRPNGSGQGGRQDGRPVAAKTGSSSDNKSAQFVGFTPQVVTAVTLYQTGTTARRSHRALGVRQISPARLHRRHLHDYMNVAHEGLEVEDFRRRPNVARGERFRRPPSLPASRRRRQRLPPPEATATSPAATTEPTPQGTPQPDGKQTEQSTPRRSSGEDQGGQGDVKVVATMVAQGGGNPATTRWQQWW